MSKRVLWVVEVNFGDGGKWEATDGCGLTKYYAARKAREWRDTNANLGVRVRKYVPQEANDG